MTLIHRLFKSLLSIFLIIATMNSFTMKVLPGLTTTLVLVYDEVSSVFLCDINEPINSDLPEIHQVTIEVNTTDVHSKLETYRNCDGILDVYEVQDFTLSLIPVDPFYTERKQWNLTNIDLPASWELTTGSADVVVAVIDTGVNQTNAITDFKTDGVLLGAAIIDGITYLDTTPGQYSYDGGSHGTAVASLISANMNNSGITGVAPGVKILPIKVFRDQAYANEEVSANGTDIAAAILWATNHGADIINLSLGGPSDYSTQAAVEYAYEQGVILVAASGNDSKNSEGIYRDVSYPAAYPQVIAVGSLNPYGASSDFSNVEGTGIDLSAYGESIYLPWLNLNNFYNLSGTSFSSPTVAGVLALMKSLYPELSPSEAKATLLSGVTDYNPNNTYLGWDIWTGYGMVNAYQALLQSQDFKSYSDTNINFATAEFLYGHHQYSSRLRPALDQDFYKFTLYETDTVTITLSTESSHDLMFDVVDATYQNIVSVDNGTSGESETVSLNNLSSGSYYVRVSDFAGRAYLEDYHIQIEYASSILPMISASTSQESISSGQTVVLPVQLSIVESLYHTVTVTKDNVPIDVPGDLLFTEIGTYVVTVDDVLNDPVQFSFTITNIYKVSSITLNSNLIYLYTLGASETLIPTILPSEAVEKSVGYVSSDPSIVEVDGNGKVTAKAAGIATITATTLDGNYSDQVVVEVVFSRHLSFELVGIGGTLSAHQGETLLNSNLNVTAGGEFLFTVEPSLRYRLYRWNINGEIISNTELTHTMVIGPTDITLSVELGLIGDLNLTDNVSTTDLVGLRRNLAGLNPLENKGLFNADMNSDGKITTTDLVQLRRVLAGLE